jgi:hypothetical protein
MPQLSYDDQVLCTVSDVRERLSSPEIPFQMNPEDDTRIAVSSVNTTTNYITTGLAHGYVAGQLVGFETTLTLPAPLVVNTGYYILNPTNTTFQLSTIKGGTAIDLTTAGTGVISAFSNTLDLLIQTKITLAKDWIRQELIQYFQTKVPTTIRQFLAFKRSQIDSAQSEFTRTIELADRGTGSWNYPAYGFIGSDGLFIDIASGTTQFGDIPVLRFCYGAPTSGTSGNFANLSTNGDVLADMKNRVLYINRGTGSPTYADPTPSPLWQVFQPKDGIDYILNPEELKHAAVTATLITMSQDGMFRNQVNYDNPTKAAYMLDSLKMWQKQYKADVERAMYAVDIDISGSGHMNDWKSGFTGSSELVICG